MSLLLVAGAGVVTLVVLVLCAVLAGVRGERGRQRVEAGIPVFTRDTFVMDAAERAIDEVDQ